MVLVTLITVGVMASAALAARSAAEAIKLCLPRHGGRGHAEEANEPSHRDDAVVLRRPRSSSRGITGESGLLRFWGQLPPLDFLGVQLSAEASRWSRRVCSFPPRVGAFRTTFAQALSNGYLPRASSTVRGMRTRATLPSATSSRPELMRHARRGGGMFTTGAVGPLFHAENPLGVQPIDVSPCPAMKLYISHVLQQGSSSYYNNLSLMLRISTGPFVDHAASGYARGNLNTVKASTAGRMLLAPKTVEQLQLGGAAIGPAAAAPHSAIATGEASLTLTAMESPCLRGRRDRSASPTRRRHATSRQTSPRGSSPSSGRVLPSARKERIAGSTVSAAPGGGVRNDCVEEESFGASFLDPPQTTARTAEIVGALSPSRPYQRRRLTRAILDNYLDETALLRLVSLLTTANATMKLQEMGVRYIGPSCPSPSSGLPVLSY